MCPISPFQKQKPRFRTDAQRLMLLTMTLLSFQLFETVIFVFFFIFVADAFAVSFSYNIFCYF